MKVSSVKQMRSMDQSAITELVVPEELLMENAGRAAAALLSKKYKNHLAPLNVVIFCGSGNNGGDGLVVARHLKSAGVRNVALVFLSSAAKFSGASLLNFNIVKKSNFTMTSYEEISEIEVFLDQFDIVIDAMLGTGITRPLKGAYLSAVKKINASNVPVLSLDIPSGVNGDTGQVFGDAIQATWTVTFGLPKIGNLLYPGFQYCGELFVSHISFPPELYDSEALSVEINSPIQLPDRNPDGHKSSFGQSLFIAGAANYLGAPYFSAMSFLKSGGGYARLATPKSISPFIGQKGSEIVFHPMAETSDGSLAMACEKELLAITKNMDFVVLGPGTSLSDETQHLLQTLATEINKPLLIDGDGLSAISLEPAILVKRNAPTILTPHLGEMARITQKSIKEIKATPISILQEYCSNWNAIIVLKGAHTLIGFPDQRVFINMSGNSGMATAGSGDVLTGVIAAMFGLGLDLENAVRSGVFLHGVAGDLAAQDRGLDGMTAHDILDFLPQTLRNHRCIENWHIHYGRYRVPVLI